MPKSPAGRRLRGSRRSPPAASTWSPARWPCIIWTPRARPRRLGQDGPVGAPGLHRQRRGAILARLLGRIILVYGDHAQPADAPRRAGLGQTRLDARGMAADGRAAGIRGRRIVQHAFWRIAFVGTSGGAHADRRR